jgi:hypothetical protein
MWTRLRSSLSYANVVSTLCLFLVIGGGGAYAKSKLINGTELKPRSVTAAKIKKHSLTNTEVDVKKLGRVGDTSRLGGKLPSAYQRAGSYLPAGGTAANANALGGQPASAFAPAGNYLPAGGTAANANALGGQPPSAYLPAGRVMSGSATTTTAGQVVFTYAPIGLTVRTNGGRFSVSLASSTYTLDISHRGGITLVRPGREWPSTTPSGSDAFDTFVVRSGDPTTLAPTVGLTITCGYDTDARVVSLNLVNCTGITFG